jgi:hypothetical protein
MHVRSALNFTYAAITQHATVEDRAEVDAWLSCSVDDAAQWAQEQRKAEWDLISSVGEVMRP